MTTIGTASMRSQNMVNPPENLAINRTSDLVEPHFLCDGSGGEGAISELETNEERRFGNAAMAFVYRTRHQIGAWKVTTFNDAGRYKH